MPARTAEWHLIEHDSDPVAGDPDELDRVARYYGDIADALITQSKLMEKIGSGDETLLKGQAADAMRKRAKDSSELLGKAANRYEQAHEAMVAYRPGLEMARSETWAAVTEAAEASSAQQAAAGRPDPVGQQRPADAPPLTDDEKGQSEARDRAISDADGKLAAARERARRAMAELDAVARRTADAIRKDWGIDGLHTSGWNAFVYGLNQVLKKLAEVLGWIGMALAIVGLVISGVGIIALVGAVIAVVALVANIILAIQGETSWLNVILGVIAVVTVGAGALVTKMTKAAQACGRVARRCSARYPDCSRLSPISRPEGVASRYLASLCQAALRPTP